MHTNCHGLPLMAHQRISGGAAMTLKSVSAQSFFSGGRVKASRGFMNICIHMAGSKGSVAGCEEASAAAAGVWGTGLGTCAEALPPPGMAGIRKGSQGFCMGTCPGAGDAGFAGVGSGTGVGRIVEAGPADQGVV